MKTLMNQLLVALRQRVTENLATLRANEKEIRYLLGEPLSNQRSYNLSNRQAFGKNILTENAENLKIQNMIVAFLGNFKDIPEYTQILESINNFEKEVSTNERNRGNEQNEREIENNKTQKPIITKQKYNEESSSNTNTSENSQTIEKSTEKVKHSLLELTTSGKLAFNSAHPKFMDQEFFEQLLNIHIQREEYEICASLMKTRK